MQCCTRNQGAGIVEKFRPSVDPYNNSNVMLSVVWWKKDSHKTHLTSASQCLVFVL